MKTLTSPKELLEKTGYKWLGYRWDDQNPALVLASSPLNSKPKHSPLDTKNLELRVQKLEEIIKHHNLTV